MTSKTLIAAALAAAFSLPIQVLAKSPAPLVPSALVEDIKSTTSEIEFMDYVGAGQVIQLQPRDVLVLSYLKSCAHETITGGTVRVGAEKSEVEGGKISRAKVACDGGKIRLSSAEANASAASAFRLQSAAISPVLYAMPPMVQIPRLQPDEARTLVIERLDRPGERQEIALSDDVAKGAFLDLGKVDAKPLARKGVYRATLGTRKVTFKIDGKATMNKPGKTPVVSRLLRFTPG